MRHRPMTATLFLAAAVLAAACSKPEAPKPEGAPATPSAAAPAASGAKALFEEKCRLCHELERALDQRKSRAEWTTTVMRMKETNACPITADEAARIVDYLAAVRGPVPK